MTKVHVVEVGMEMKKKWMHRRSGNGEGNMDKGRDEDKHMIGDLESKREQRNKELKDNANG